MVVRSYFVKRQIGEHLSHCERIDDEEKITENVIQCLNKTSKQIGWMNIDTPQQLWDFCDFLILTIKSVYSSADKGAAEAVIPSLIIAKPKKIAEALDEISDPVLQFLKVPADPRAGFNLASLWTNQMLTSALVVAHTYNNQSPTEGKYEITEPLAALRCASLLYALGRPGSFMTESSSAADRVKMLLDGILSSNLQDKISEIIDGNTESSRKDLEIIRNASMYATSYQTTKKTILSLMMRDYQWIENDFEDYKKWDSILFEQMEQICEAFVSTKPPESKQTSEFDDGPLSIIFGDVSGIQQSIKQTDRLAQLMGASALIDGFMKDTITLRKQGLPSLYSVLRDNHIPIEAAISSGGGNILLIASSIIAEDLSSMIRTAFKELPGKSKLVLASSKFSIIDGSGSVSETPFMANLNHARQKTISVKNDLLVADSIHIGFGLEMRCQSCGESAASVKVVSGDRTRSYCHECKALQDFGNEYSFKSTYEHVTPFRLNGESLTGLSWDAFSDQIMTFLAGNPPLKPAEPTNETDLAIIKADANLAGAFISNAKSLVELVEKNLLLTKELFESAMSAYKWLTGLIRMHLKTLGLEEEKNEPELLWLRLDLGMLYVGGDDLMLLCPSAYSVPISLKIVEEFGRRLGNALGLSASVITFPPDLPIRLVMEASENLLEYCKEVSREISGGKPKPINIVDYEMLKGSIVAPKEVANVHRYWRDESYSQRPIIVSKKPSRIMTALVLDDSPENILDNLVLASLEHDLSVRGILHVTDGTRLKQFWQSALEPLEQMMIPATRDDNADQVGVRGTGISFSVYLAGRSNIKSRPAAIYREIGLLILGDDDGKMGLFDAAILARILMGGR